MSADNGIYILECNDGCRVVEAQAIDNIYYQPDETGFNTEMIQSYFGNSKVFSREEAQKEAFRIQDEIHSNGWWTEYGISSFRYPYDFPK